MTINILWYNTLSYLDNSEISPMNLQYTFNTKFAKELVPFFPKIFIFRRLKYDFERFSSLIQKHQPEYIIGIAKSPYPLSQIETITINQFNKTKKVIRNAPEKYDLYVQKEVPNEFRIAHSPTDSFCNWTMFQIAHLIKKNKLNPKLSFVHLREQDIKIFRGFLFP